MYLSEIDWLIGIKIAFYFMSYLMDHLLRYEIKFSESLVRAYLKEHLWFTHLYGVKAEFLIPISMLLHIDCCFVLMGQETHSSEQWKYMHTDTHTHTHTHTHTNARILNSQLFPCSTFQSMHLLIDSLSTGYRRGLSVFCKFYKSWIKCVKRGYTF